MPTRALQGGLHLADDLQRRGSAAGPWRAPLRRRRGQCGQAQAVGDAPGQVLVDVPQVADHGLAHVRVPTLESSNTSAEAMCACSAAVWLTEEQPRLAVVVGEALRRGRGPCPPASAALGRCGSRSAASRAATSVAVERVGLVVDAALRLCICMCPSRWRLANGHLGALIGIWWKLAEPSRDSCVSRYENSRPCSSGSLEKSMPGHDVAPGSRPTCSVSAKKLSGQRSSTMPPDHLQRHHFLGDQLGRIEMVEREVVAPLPA